MTQTTMNPFLNHPILKDLPYKLMKNPDREKIIKHIEKQRRMRQRLGLFAIVYGVVLAIASASLLNKFAFGPALNMLNSAFFILLGVWFYRRANNYRLSLQELDEMLEKVKQNQQ